MENHPVLRIAVLQARALAHSPTQNTATALAQMERAHAQGADLLLFPECFLTGYTLPATNEDALDESAPQLVDICQKAKSLGMGVVITALTKGQQKPQNSAFVIGRQGEILMKYSKVHTCDFSLESCLEGGAGFFVCSFDGVKLGVMICYDREYPESARVLMLMGAEIILVPNDCTLMKPRINALSTRAYENMTGVVMANPPGKGAGGSCAFSPIPWDDDENCLDMEIFVADELTEDIFIAEYNLVQLRDYRNSEMMGNTFRKVHAYAPLLGAQVEAPFIRSTGNL